jgi:hypothetical protein
MCFIQMGVTANFKAFPSWFIAVGIFVAGSLIQQRRVARVA